MEELLKILIVDDDEVDRIAVRRALRAADFSVELTEVDTCASAIAALEQQTFDCVFLDYCLPDGNGLELVQAARKISVSIPLVVLTGQGDEQIAVSLIKAGAADYLAKAKISSETLCRSLRNSLRIFRAEFQAEQASQKLRESEQRFRSLVQNSSDIIAIVDTQGLVQYASPSIEQILGYKPEEFIGTCVFNPLHPEDAAQVLPVVRQSLEAAGGISTPVEFRFRHTDGSWVYLEAIANNLVNDSSVGGVVINARDISERKKSETERERLLTQLELERGQFEAVLRQMPAGVVIAKAPSGELVLGNEQVEQIWGHPFYSVAGVEQYVQYRGFHADGRPYQSEEWPLARSIDAGEVVKAEEINFQRGDGTRRIMSANSAPIRDRSGKIVAGVVIFNDITEQKQAEKNRIESEQRFRTMADSAPVLLWLTGVNGKRYFFNQAWLNFTGCGLEQELENAWLNRLDPHDRSQYLALYAKAFNERQPLELEYRLQRADGEYRWILATETPRFLPDGSFTGYIGSGIDITDRKRTEEVQQFLSEASILLSTSLDYKIILKNLAELVVSYFADWCAIDILDADQVCHRLAVAHANVEKEALVQQLAEIFPAVSQGDRKCSQVIQTGQSQAHFYVTESLLADLVPAPEQRELLQQLQCHSYISVPLIIGERVLGSILVVMAESGRHYHQADLALAEELARRAALAVENARLYREAQAVGENLRQAIIILGEQQQQLHTLQHLTNLLSQRLADLPELLQVMVQAVLEAFPGAQFCLIGLHDSKDHILQPTAIAGIGIERLTTAPSLYAPQAPLGQVLLTGKSQLIKQDVSTYGAAEALPAAICAVAIEPSKDRRLGVLAIGNWNYRDAFDEEDRHLLIAFGEQAAIAISNAQLIHTLEEREERLAAQNRILAQQNFELENQRQQIQLQNLRLMEATRLKSQFLATMSHELRTPMNAITGFSQLLLRQRHSSLNPQQVDMVERILSNGKNLLALINDILDLSKIEAGRMDLQLEEIDVVRLVTLTVEELRFLAQEKNLSLAIESNITQPQVMNDRSRLRQILVNLLSNAIKFTEEGGVLVKISERFNDSVEIAVQDTGIGIAKTDLQHIFEEFRQVDQTPTRKYPGTGLGLAICQRLVQMMHGSITVESNLGTGSTFYLNIPRRIVPLTTVIE